MKGSSTRYVDTVGYFCSSNPIEAFAVDEDTPFTAVDRDLLQRCLDREPGSWNDFVDRFLSLIYHTIGYTAHLRSVRIGPEDVEDIAAEIMLRIVAGNFRILPRFPWPVKSCNLPHRRCPTHLHSRTHSPPEDPRCDQSR